MNEQKDSICRYSCSQLFGEGSDSQQNIDEDNITSLRFDESGKLLAVGDRAGRLIVFNAIDPNCSSPQYDYGFQFQSHQKDFDTLKSLSIREEISYINWLKPQGKYHKLLTANSSTVKLWKLFEKRQRRMVKRADSDLCLPVFEEQPAMSVNLKKSFPHKNFCALKAVNLSKNEEYIFTTDQSNVLLWSMQQSSKPYFLKQFSNSVNKGVERTEKITCAQLHPETQTLFIYGTNKGVLALNDIRASIANCNTLSFNCQRDQNFLSEIINQYTAAIFLENTRKIVTRDLISVKVWDMCNPKHPLSTLFLDQNLKTRLCDLFEADCLDDKFKLSSNHGNILTGNYSNSFHLINSQSGNNMQYELDYQQITRKRQVGSDVPRTNPFSSKNKVLCHDYNKISGQVAVSAYNCFFIYSEEQNVQFQV